MLPARRQKNHRKEEKGDLLQAGLHLAAAALYESILSLSRIVCCRNRRLLLRNK